MVGQTNNGKEGRERVKSATREQEEGRVTEEQEEGRNWVPREQGEGSKWLMSVTGEQGEGSEWVTIEWGNELVMG
jgi:hypothetical protein